MLGPAGRSPVTLAAIGTVDACERTLTMLKARVAQLQSAVPSLRSASGSPGASVPPSAPATVARGLALGTFGAGDDASPFAGADHSGAQLDDADEAAGSGSQAGRPGTADDCAGAARNEAGGEEGYGCDAAAAGGTASSSSTSGSDTSTGSAQNSPQSVRTAATASSRRAARSSGDATSRWGTTVGPADADAALSGDVLAAAERLAANRRRRLGRAPGPTGMRFKPLTPSSDDDARSSAAGARAFPGRAADAGSRGDAIAEGASGWRGQQAALDTAAYLGACASSSSSSRATLAAVARGAAGAAEGSVQAAFAAAASVAAEAAGSSAQAAGDAVGEAAEAGPRGSASPTASLQGAAASASVGSKRVHRISTLEAQKERDLRPSAAKKRASSGDGVRPSQLAFAAGAEACCADDSDASEQVARGAPSGCPQTAMEAPGCRSRSDTGTGSSSSACRSSGSSNNSSSSSVRPTAAEASAESRVRS